MKKALVVGLNSYPGCPLEWCDNDANSIADLLESNSDGSPNFEVRSIIDECDNRTLSQAIEKVFADEADIALFYFSGHGSDLDQGYLCTSDFNDENPGIKMTDVITLANQSRCKKKVIILDCCFSAKMGEFSLANNESVLGEGVTIMSASQTWQASEENNIIQHGLFTELLIQGLKGGAADIRGNITPASLYAYVDQSLGGWKQRPVFKTNISRFLSLRNVQPRVPVSTLRKIGSYFKSPTDQYDLDPSYEFTNTQGNKIEPIEPYANDDNVAIFKDLQLFESVGLVEPVDAEHMYFAAMASKSCKLTALGLHYWRLSKDHRF